MPKHSKKNQKEEEGRVRTRITRATAHLCAMFNQEEERESTPANAGDGIFNKTIFDMIQKMSVDLEDLKAIKEMTASVDEKLSSFVTRLTEVEDRVSGIEDTLAKQKENPPVTKAEWRELRDQMAMMEDRSRRNNLRFVGFSEGIEKNDATGLLSRFITTTLDITATAPQGFEIERAHRTPTQRTAYSERPRTIIATFLRHQDCLNILRAAREKQQITWEGKQVMIFPDYSRETQGKREAFRQCKKLLHERKIKFSLLYPALLIINTGGGPSRTFDEPQKAIDFIHRL
ncbi:unnamed protein product [Knipowitschia caucasica]